MPRSTPPRNPELTRLKDDKALRANWKRWGPYLAERQWGTVREDYSKDGEAWNSFPYEHSLRRAYRWGEDGLLGFTDRECRLCFAPALWNGRDPHLKERLFGLTGPEGNHGEDVKELYYYLDSLPTHAYAKALYKYPQAAYPYEALRRAGRERGLNDPEFEIEDSGVFEANRYFDLQIEYAKNSPNDLLIRIRVTNRGPEAHALHLLPTVWFRNTWTWGCEHEGCTPKPTLQLTDAGELAIEHDTLQHFHFAARATDGSSPEWLFTENESNARALWGHDTDTPYVKDAFHRYVVNGESGAVNPAKHGTKAAPYFHFQIAAGESVEVHCRLSAEDEHPSQPFGAGFDKVFAQRIRETETFYQNLRGHPKCDDNCNIQRQAYAGLLWSKQFYHYSVNDWLQGDPGTVEPPRERRKGRNHGWKHLFNRNILSMPDKWEYPWYAAWDLAFHMIPLCRIDPELAKYQLLLLLREWYMHPNGQIPAYEWNFSDVNPPVHAWAVWRVYKMTGAKGERDLDFLKQAFLKLLLNFTWWVNRKDAAGENLFSGGFLGLDNIGAFDRSKPLPEGAKLQQADGTAWMAFYCSTMLSMALELAQEDPAFDALASKFFEHFMNIADAMNTVGGTGLWDEDKGFYYDLLKNNGSALPIRIRSLVGLIPLLAVEVLDDQMTSKLPRFRKRMEWFLKHRHDLQKQITFYECASHTNGRHLLAIPSRQRLERVLAVMLDEEEFLSPYGLRSLSKQHETQPFSINFHGEQHDVHYTPGESDSHLFGGNSNWRGPIWLPLNHLLIESLEKYHHFYGDDFKVECPTGSGQMRHLKAVARELETRITRLFQKDAQGHRPMYGGTPAYQTDPHFKDLVLFHEYFHGDNGKGLGASHQTGWTALVAEMIDNIDH